MSSPKPLRGVVLDVSGGAIEWNIDANMRPKANTVCGDKACVTKDSWIVGHQKGFGRGICAGTMMWSYTHQHLGALNSTMFINGKPHCTSLPIHGTDATNPPGNEKGFVVKFTDCVDHDGLGNSVRLNQGDKLAIEAWYDVDKDSTGSLPLPGGKHGGIMDLFFAMMDCDPGTFGEIYVCRQAACVPSFKRNVGKGTHYATLGDCQAACA